MITKHSKLRQNQVRLLFELSNWVSNLAQYLATVKNTLNTHKHIYIHTHICLWVKKSIRKKKTKCTGAKIHVPRGWGEGKQDTFRPRLLNFGYNQDLSPQKIPPKRNKTKPKHIKMQDKAFSSLDTWFDPVIREVDTSPDTQGLCEIIDRNHSKKC